MAQERASRGEEVELTWDVEGWLSNPKVEKGQFPPCVERCFPVGTRGIVVHSNVVPVTGRHGNAEVLEVVQGEQVWRLWARPDEYRRLSDGASCERGEAGPMDGGV